MIKYMLDTNIVIYTMKNRPAKVRRAFKKHKGEMCLSPVSLGELFYGAEKSSQVEHNLEVIESMVARMELPAFDFKAAAHFGQLRAELMKSGRIIGPYDLMIAGHARSLGLTLVTNNLREFKRVPGLRVENWV